MSDLKLFDFQQEIIEGLREGFRQKHRAQLLYAPAGAGKTECAMALMEATAAKMKSAAMVLDRIVLCNQTSARLDKYRIPHGVMQSGHWRFRPYERIQVCSAQTLEKRGTFPGLNLLIVDECHDQRAQTLEFIKSNTDVFAVGLTASPFSKGLGATYTNVVSVTTIKKLVERGRLAPLRVFICKEVDMTGAKKLAGEWSENEAASRGMKITGDIVAEWTAKTMEIFGRPVKTAVFCANVAHGVDLAQQFNAAGHNFICLSYKDDDEYRQDVLKDFARPDTEIQGVIAVDLLSKGWDQADCLIGISARPFSKSFNQHIQQLGRLQRSHPSKEFGVWLDFSGNYLRFKDDWDELYENGVSGMPEEKEKPRKEPSEQEKKEARCPKCNCVWPSASDTCPSCGFVRLLRSSIVNVPGVMEEIASAHDKALRQDFWSGMLFLADARGKERGWALGKFKDKWGAWPTGLHDERKEPTMEMVKWEHSRRIAYAKRAAKERKAMG